MISLNHRTTCLGLIRSGAATLLNPYLAATRTIVKLAQSGESERDKCLSILTLGRGTWRHLSLLGLLLDEEGGCLRTALDLKLLIHPIKVICDRLGA